MTSAVESFEELARLEPALAALEQEARAVEDDGSATFFCSNFLWLPMYTRLKTIVGVHRPHGRQRSQGDASADPLFDSRSFEVAYEHLSRLLPPCRDCGCRLFDPIRERQIGREA